MNPLYGYIAIAWLLTLGGAGWYGMSLGEDRVEARVAKTNELIAAVEARAQLGAANAIAANKPVHRTIQSKVETIVKEVPVYRDCVTTPDVVGLLDASRALSTAPGDRSVPAVGAGGPQ